MFAIQFEGLSFKVTFFLHKIESHSFMYIYIYSYVKIQDTSLTCICILTSLDVDRYFTYSNIDLHHVSRLHLTDLPSGSPRPNLLDETLSSSSTSAALSPAASASCHQLTSRKLRPRIPRNRFELFTLHESRCVEKKRAEKMYMSSSKSN